MSKKDSGLEGHDEPCAFCGENCNSLAGNPVLWPTHLADLKRPGKMAWYHMSCVTSRLQAAESSLKVIRAATFANFCPDAGGYLDGRSVEDCYEDLNRAVNEYYGTDIECPMSEYISEEELEQLLKTKLNDE